MLISRVLNNTVPTIWGTVLKYMQHCLLYLWCTYKCTYNLYMFGSRLQEPLGQCRTIALEKTNTAEWVYICTIEAWNLSYLSIYLSIYLPCCWIVLVLPVSWYVRKSIYHKCQTLRLRLFAFHGRQFVVRISLGRTGTGSPRATGLKLKGIYPSTSCLKLGTQSRKLQNPAQEMNKMVPQLPEYLIPTKFLAFLAGEWRSEWDCREKCLRK